MSSNVRVMDAELLRDLKRQGYECRRLEGLSQDPSLAAKREHQDGGSSSPPIIPPHTGLLIFLRGEVLDSGKGFLRQEGLTLKTVQNHFPQKLVTEPPPPSPEPPILCEKVQAGEWTG